MTEYIEVFPSPTLKGEAALPGDKSISQRAAIMAALASGETEIVGYIDGEDGDSTLGALRALGAAVERSGDRLVIRGVGDDGFQDPATPVDLGNSGTGLRLLLGALAGEKAFATLWGDPSLSRRPMGRVVLPLRRMGAQIDGRSGGDLLPLAIRGGALKSLDYETPVASAQVKSALLLAGLGAHGTTRVVEPAPSRDHTERMLPQFGASVRFGPGWAEVDGPTRLKSPGRFAVPKDPSAAAFGFTAAVLAADGEVWCDGVSVNPTRLGWVEALQAMGAAIEVTNGGDDGEPVGSIRARASRLRGVTIADEMVPAAIDEIPILCVAAALAEGTTVIRDAAELRLKESDRLRAIAEEWGKLGIEVEERPDGLIIEGPQRIRGGRCSSRGDHRIAMALIVAGLFAESPVIVEGTECIRVSFPGFGPSMEALGAKLRYGVD